MTGIFIFILFVTKLKFVCLFGSRRLVQFYIQIGSKTSGITCIKPRARNEGKLKCVLNFCNLVFAVYMLTRCLCMCVCVPCVYWCLWKPAPLELKLQMVVIDLGSQASLGYTGDTNTIISKDSHLFEGGNLQSNGWNGSIHHTDLHTDAHSE